MFKKKLHIHLARPLHKIYRFKEILESAYSYSCMLVCSCIRINTRICLYSYTYSYAFVLPLQLLCAACFLIHSLTLVLKMCWKKQEKKKSLPLSKSFHVQLHDHFISRFNETGRANPGLARGTLQAMHRQKRKIERYRIPVYVKVVPWKEGWPSRWPYREGVR